MYIHIFCLLGPRCKQQKQCFFFQFDHRTESFNTWQHPYFHSSWKCYHGPLLIMSFFKVCNLWSCKQTGKKASHTWPQAQLGWLIKSYGSRCLYWSSQKVISNRVYNNTYKNKKQENCDDNNNSRNSCCREWCSQRVFIVANRWVLALTEDDRSFCWNMCYRFTGFAVFLKLFNSR